MNFKHINIYTQRRITKKLGIEAKGEKRLLFVTINGLYFQLLIGEGFRHGIQLRLDRGGDQRPRHRPPHTEEELQAPSLHWVHLHVR